MGKTLGNPSFAIRPMVADDLPAGLQLCRAAGWNQILRDWDILIQQNPHGCLVACQGDTVIGTATIARYAGRFAWLGMVLVDPAERGQGIGTALVRQAIDNVPAGEAVKLDATPVGREVYRQLGFVDEARLVRLAGVAPSRPPSETSPRPMVTTDLTRIAAWDEPIFGAPRMAWLSWWLAGGPAYGWIDEVDGVVHGYCLGRRGYSHDQVGPLVARDFATARRLITACWRATPTISLILDVPAEQHEWIEWLGACGFHEQRPLVRMYRGENRYPGRPKFQYAIMAPEIG